MDEFLTIAEIKHRFDSEWILVGDPSTDKSMQVNAGKVLWHSRDRDEVYRKAVELRPERFAMLFTGQLPKNTAIIL